MPVFFGRNPAPEVSVEALKTTGIELPRDERGGMLPPQANAARPGSETDIKPPIYDASDTMAAAGDDFFPPVKGETKR